MYSPWLLHCSLFIRPERWEKESLRGAMSYQSLSPSKGAPMAPEGESHGCHPRKPAAPMPAYHLLPIWAKTSNCLGDGASITLSMIECTLTRFWGMFSRHPAWICGAEGVYLAFGDNSKRLRVHAVQVGLKCISLPCWGSARMGHLTVKKAEQGDPVGAVLSVNNPSIPLVLSFPAKWFQAPPESTRNSIILWHGKKEEEIKRAE